ncbi:hypothetical protein MKK88_33440 [Methylobacterium sp. E-005]|uniref:hypothetical protein n=1 Tax=Methylobacterium sp. E-005 TaxID=2836549 RepID=UPI001FB91880|nr:hypothetical protein [Methylobacterium sp. E-005]MCJ2090850.1 hypothetical protein [Methylobacterium sp. E-005]
MILTLRPKIRILHKIIAIVAVIGAIVGGCIWHASGRMDAVGAQYAHFILHDAKMADSVRRIVRLFHQTNYAIYRVIAET